MTSARQAKKLRIAFVTGNYPSAARPFEGTFVQQFVWAMARQGNVCTVIKPTSLFNRRFGVMPPRAVSENAGDDARVTVHYPKYLSFSSKDLLLSHTGRWTTASFTIAVTTMIRQLGPDIDLIYGHFLYHAGFAALVAGEMSERPTVIGVGEDHLWTVNAFGIERAKVHFKHRGFFLANSTPNADLLGGQLGISRDRIMIEPNGIDLSFMYPRDRQAMREKHGVNEKDFVIVFVGANEVRKGPERVLAAIEGMTDVRCIFAGMGTETLQSSAILRQGPCPHAIIPELLSCGDLFVLPTTSEGSCNAVLEAMSCGLPLVTSNGRYMDDIVDDSVAIRTDPMDVAAIRNAVMALKNDPDRRRNMSHACLEKARKFDINERAQRVTEWMTQLKSDSTRTR